MDKDINKGFWVDIDEEDSLFRVSVIRNSRRDIKAERVADFPTVVNLVDDLLFANCVGFGSIAIPLRVINSTPLGDSREWRFCEECLRWAMIKDPEH